MDNEQTSPYTVVCTLLTAMGVSHQHHAPDIALAALGLESLHVLQMLFDLEQQYSIKIPDDSLYAFETIGDVVTYLESHGAQPDTQSIPEALDGT